MRKENKSPKVKITKLNLNESCWCQGGNTWNAAGLVEHCKAKNYISFKLPLAGINTSVMPFTINTLNDFVWHVQRVKNSDLKYPIILDDRGQICDGYHRICKALLEGRTEIDAIRIEEMPEPDGREGNENC